MPTLKISNADARRVLLDRYQLGAQGAVGKPAKQRLISLMYQLGYVQLDSIRIVERAQHHILHGRLPSYRPKHIDGLYGPEPAAFEHWTHDTSLIPIEFYPHWRHKFAAAKKKLETSERWQKRIGDPAGIKNMVRHLETAGPTRSRDLDSRTGERGAWWDWAPHKAALEYLWTTGRVAVVRRDGFQKIYDLSERVIPKAQRDERPSFADTTQWACSSALDRLGIASAAELQDFWSLIPRKAVDKWIANQLKKNLLIEVEIDGHGARPLRVFANHNIEHTLKTCPPPRKRLHILSPFDPLIRNRKRTAALFGFDYRIEIFIPAAKRRFGYYVFPLLDGDKFVGRAEIKADRDMGAVYIDKIWWEPGLRPSKGREARLERAVAKLHRLAGF